MKDQYESYKPLQIIPIIAVSSYLDAGLINCRNLDKINITCKATFAAESDTDLLVYVYYSPDGKVFDTEYFGSLTLTDVAGTVVQKSALISVPDTGWLKIVLYNGSEAKTISNIFVWASVIYKFYEDKQTDPST
jgi:hypothetical protein